MLHGSRYIATALLLAVSLMGSGCAGGWLANHVPWHKKDKDDEMPGIKTADKRIKEIQALAEKAPTSTPEVQQQVSEKLAHQIEKETDPLIREEILKTLAVYPTPLAAKVLEAGMSDNEAGVRIICCGAWAKRGGNAAVEALGTALNNDSDLDVKMAAARALGQLKDKGAVVPLSEALASDNPAMQRRAIESLKTVSGHDYGNNLDAWRQYAKTGQAPPDTPVASKSWWRRWY